MNPLRRLFAAVRRRPFRTLAIVLFAAFVGLNVLAYRHARAMLTFDSAAARTASPQALSLVEKLKVVACGVSIPRPANERTPEALGLPFTTFRIRTSDGVGLEGWRIDAQSAQGTVLLFHGYAASRASLLSEAQAFCDLGYSVVLVDFRGSGGSDRDSTTLGYEEGGDVAAAVDFARMEGLARPHVLYGQSMGGAAILRAVAAHDVRPDGIVLDSVFDRMLGTVQNRFRLMKLPPFPAAELLVFWGGRQAGFDGFTHNPVEYARRCECPTLVQIGALDRNVGVDESRTLFGALAGRKEYAVFDAAGHVSLLAADRALWSANVERHLKSLTETGK